MYITDDTQIAQIAEKSGVDLIFVDLEINGKDERQAHLDTVISRHQIEDVKKIKDVLKIAKLLVRVNPLCEESKAEIERVINDGADIIMLPFFKTKEEVNTFVRYVDNRAEVMLLLETPEAVGNLDEILAVDGIDYVHIGLNDLHIGYKMQFMFELLADGTVDKICEKIEKKGIQYGFGGIARLGQGELASEYVMGEHYRLNSSMAILSRSFYNTNKVPGPDKAKQVFDKGVSEIRNYELELIKKDRNFFEENRVTVKNKIIAITNRKQTVSSGK